MNDTKERINKMLKKSELILNAGKPKPMTNEEYLHLLNTEQLAEWIAKCIKDTIILTHGNRKYTDNIVSTKWWAEWLKQQR
jgi:hypothetical protein